MKENKSVEIMNMFYNVKENRKLQDPFLAKDICRLCHSAYYDFIDNQFIARTSVKLARNADKSPQVKQTIEQYIIHDYNYLVVSGFLQSLGKRGMPNNVYLFLYDDIIDLIDKQINEYFDGRLHIVAIEKNNVESFSQANWVINVMEEGVYYLFETPSPPRPYSWWYEVEEI